MIEYRPEAALIPYLDAMQVMDARIEDVISGRAPELVWLLEHESCYTGGTSAKDTDLLDPQFPVYPTGRGGQYTYHGPGQQIAYFVLDLKKRQGEPDLRKFVFDLEQIVIDTLADFDITGERREGRVGVWVQHADGREEKIAAIGVRVRKWVTSHGLSINVIPDLGHYAGIVPCGIAEHGVTSLSKLGVPASMEDVSARLLHHIARRFDAEGLA